MLLTTSYIESRFEIADHSMNQDERIFLSRALCRRFYYMKLKIQSLFVRNVL